MMSTLPADLMQPGRIKRGFARILSAKADYDPRTDLALIRDLLIIDSKEAAPMWWIRLLELLNSFFSELQRCTFFYGFSGSPGHLELAAAAADAIPARQDTQDLLHGIGISKRVVFEEAIHSARKMNIRHGWGWERIQASLEARIYPILRLKVAALRRKREPSMPSLNRQDDFKMGRITIRYQSTGLW